MLPASDSVFFQFHISPSADQKVPSSTAETRPNRYSIGIGHGSIGRHLAITWVPWFFSCWPERPV